MPRKLTVGAVFIPFRRCMVEHNVENDLKSLRGVTCAPSNGTPKSPTGRPRRNAVLARRPVCYSPAVVAAATDDQTFFIQKAVDWQQFDGGDAKVRKWRIIGGDASPA